MSGSTRSSADLDVRRRRNLFRAWHRGIREMDLIMGRFADAEIDQLAAWAEEGYEVLSISGGEPLLYPGLVSLSLGARSLGLRVHVITNGFAVSARQVATLAPLLDLVAVSIDGDERMHDEIRRAPGSFRRAVASLGKFRDAGLAVAVVSCVTKLSLPMVPELHDLCVREGVSLLSLRPVVAVGAGVVLRHPRNRPDRG